MSDRPVCKGWRHTSGKPCERPEDHLGLCGPRDPFFDTTNDERAKATKASSLAAEERKAWDRFAAAFLASTERHCGDAVDDGPQAAARHADKMLELRRARFGGGQ